MNKKLFCFGFGYTCDYLERLLHPNGVESTEEKWEVWGTTSSVEKGERFAERDIHMILQDQEQVMSDIDALLQGTTHLLISVPPKNLGCPIFRSYFRDIARLDSLEWIGYLSTTGVYGNQNGGWVDEKSEVRPSTIRGSRRAKAEEQWLSLVRRYDAPTHLFRLSGIYGEGRSALDSIQAGIARRIYKEGHVFNRIHVEDIAQTLVASMKNPQKGGAIYNVSDDEPAASHEIISEAAEILDVEEPPLVDIEYANLAPMTASFYSDNKRIRNNKIKEELGIELKYPTYREGLRGCVKGG